MVRDGLHCRQVQTRDGQRRLTLPTDTDTGWSETACMTADRYRHGMVRDGLHCRQVQTRGMVREGLHCRQVQTRGMVRDGLHCDDRYRHGGMVRDGLHCRRVQTWGMVRNGLHCRHVQTREWLETAYTADRYRRGEWSESIQHAPDQRTVSQADEGAVRIPKDRPSYFDISKVPIDGQMFNAFNDNICFI